MRIDLVADLIYGFIRKDKKKIEQGFSACIANEREGQVKNRFRFMLNEYHRREGLEVVAQLQPAVRQMVNAPYQDCTFDDLMLSDEIKQDIDRMLTEWQYREELIANGLSPVNKVLLEGPPGNGKTSCATAIAKKLGIPILNTNSSLILDSYLGKSEQNVSVLFNNLPETCVLFFDEFEALVSSRGQGNDGGGAGRAWNSIVTSFLVNMERIRPSVFFIAATNRTDMMDKAVLRRFDMRLEFENPTREEKNRYMQLYLDRHGLSAGQFMTDKVVRKAEKAVSYSTLENVMKKRHKELIIDGLLKKTV